MTVRSNGVIVSTVIVPELLIFNRYRGTQGSCLTVLCTILLTFVVQ